LYYTAPGIVTPVGGRPVCSQFRSCNNNTRPSPSVPLIMTSQ